MLELVNPLLPKSNGYFQGDKEADKTQDPTLLQELLSTQWNLIYKHLFLSFSFSRSFLFSFLPPLPKDSLNNRIELFIGNFFSFVQDDDYAPLCTLYVCEYLRRLNLVFLPEGSR